MQLNSGHISVPGGRVWYELAAPDDATHDGHGSTDAGHLPRDASQLPLVALHGGPGFAHYYLKPLCALADTRPVLLYDQLGCGHSQGPDAAYQQSNNPWSVQRFVAELDAIVNQLGLARFHLLGHSWGTVIAFEYCLLHRSRVASLILGSSCLSLPLWLADARRLRARLPRKLRDALNAAEQSGDYSSPEFYLADREYDRRHLTGAGGITPELHQSKAVAGAEVYRAMWGPTEYSVQGTLRDYDARARLPEIDVPTLFFCGRHDEATPRSSAELARLVPQSRLVVFQKSAHHPHLSERGEFIDVLQHHLHEVERGNFAAEPRWKLSLRKLAYVVQGK